MDAFCIMKNKTALVTGGMGGIGTAVCQQLCQQGARVIATYNRGGNRDAAIAWREEQLSKGYDIAIYYVDVSDFQSCQQMIHEIEADFASIDILVNNAGITRDVQFYKMNQEQWQVVLHTNLDSFYNMTRQVIESMEKRRYGRVINISSINGQKGQFGQTNYSTAKAGIHGFTKALAQEVAHKGITVNTISPGYIETPMIMAVNPKVREKIIEQIPVGRFGTPDEVAHVVIFLAKEESGFITGSNIMINGGQYLV